MEWQFCVCGKVVDEFEDKCYWCGTLKKDLEQKNSEKDNQLKLNFGDYHER